MYWRKNAAVACVLAFLCHTGLVLSRAQVVRWQLIGFKNFILMPSKHLRQFLDVEQGGSPRASGSK